MEDSEKVWLIQGENNHNICVNREMTLKSAMNMINKGKDFNIQYCLLTLKDEFIKGNKKFIYLKNSRSRQ